MEEADFESIVTFVAWKIFVLWLSAELYILRGGEGLHGKSLLLNTCTLTQRNWGVTLELDHVNLLDLRIFYSNQHRLGHKSSLIPPNNRVTFTSKYLQLSNA
jgi:hypothetical protein